MRYDRWYAVASRRFITAPIGRHLLAELLSEVVTVLAITAVAGRYSEVAVYRGGALAQLSVAGLDVPQDTPSAAPVDASWLEALTDPSSGLVRVPADVLRTRFGDADALADRLGLDARGFANIERKRVEGSTCTSYRLVLVEDRRDA